MLRPKSQFWPSQSAIPPSHSLCQRWHRRRAGALTFLRAIPQGKIQTALDLGQHAARSEGQAVLPDADHRPSIPGQGAIDKPVPCRVAAIFLHPICLVGGGRATTPRAAVPETAVDENGHALARKGKVRAAKQRPPPPPATDAGAPEKRHQPQLGAAIAAGANARHDACAHLGAENVGHAASASAIAAGAQSFVLLISSAQCQRGRKAHAQSGGLALKHCPKPPAAGPRRCQAAQRASACAAPPFGQSFCVKLGQRDGPGGSEPQPPLPGAASMVASREMLGPSAAWRICAALDDPTEFRIADVRTPGVLGCPSAAPRRFIQGKSLGE